MDSIVHMSAIIVLLRVYKKLRHLFIILKDCIYIFIISYRVSVYIHVLAFIDRRARD
jgi:hypothetical protein